MVQNRLLSRRRVLYLGLGTLAGIGALRTETSINSFEQNSVFTYPNKTFKVIGKKSLKERAAAKGIMYGSAVLYNDLTSSPKYAKLVAQECGILVPEWELKWSAGDKHLRPNSRGFDFKPADWIANFARTNKMLLRGHTLVWHDSLPKWFNEQANQQNAESLLTNHIQTVMRHYAGKMHSWDVVNEAILIDDGLPHGLRKSPWLEFLGPGYIDLAFRLAAKADPKALLVYNDYGLEYDTPEDEAKRNAVLKLLERLKAQGTPIHALGIQSHLSGHATNFKPQKLRKFLGDVASLGLKIMITELDAVDQKLPLNMAVRDRIIAGSYEDYLSAVLDEKAVIAVTTWGLSDRYTFVSESHPRKDRAGVRPLPFDRNFKRKLVWNAMARAFDHAPHR